MAGYFYPPNQFLLSFLLSMYKKANCEKLYIDGIIVLAFAVNEEDMRTHNECWRMVSVKCLSL